MKLNKELLKTIEILVETIPKNIKWGFRDGTAAFFYGSGREPTDLDICTNNYGIQKISEILNEFLLKSAEKISKNIFEIYIAKFKVNEYEIEVYSESSIIIDSKVHPKSIDEEQLKRIRKIKIKNIEIPLLSPEDVIASKALTQRGKEVGKYDIDDVKAILESQKIDWKYLEERAKRMKGYDRIFGLLRYLGYKI
jgi:DNA polymerase elongation subunit (family B)